MRIYSAWSCPLGGWAARRDTRVMSWTPLGLGVRAVRGSEILVPDRRRIFSAAPYNQTLSYSLHNLDSPSTHTSPPIQQIPPFRNRPLTLGQNRSLTADLRQTAHDFLIPINEPIKRVRNAHIPTELQHELLCPPQIMSRDTGEQMMNRLELQPAVDEIQPLGTINVHGCAEHALGEGFTGSEVHR